MKRGLAGLLWLGVGLAKIAALVRLIDGDWRQALLALLAAWAMAGLAVWTRAATR
ncbi:hypothetical protein [Sandarakinorhabdus cyanobacteriorum]|uniref:hypothetical protein n=1 Tax=Sandarakinorhabdus cyanobacteriorum TaxID=1981098 RepID=UPI0013FD2CE4|nr:hypothetical protein [Sandarakinorhabdus cyanobacteriorum]